MNILIVTNDVFPGNIRIANETLALVRSGVEVTIVSVSPGYKGNCESVWKGAMVYQVPLAKQYRKWMALSAEFPVYSWACYRAMRHLWQRLDPDVVQVYNIYVFQAVRRLMAASRAKLVLDIAENIPEIMKSYDHVKRGPGRFLINNAAWVQLQKRCIRQSDHVILVSEEAIEDYNMRYGLDRKRVIALPNLVEPDLIGFERCEEILKRFKGDQVLFYFGDTSFRRGTGLAVEAMEAIVRRIPDAMLLIVGANRREDKRLHNRIQLSPVSHRIRFEGYRPMSELGSYLRAATIGISPLERNVHHDTTYANKVFQYMYGGLPLLVSDCPPQANLIHRYDCGVVHTAGSVQSFASQAIKLLEDPKVMERMGENGQMASKEELSWDRYTSRYLEDLRRLLT